VFKSIQRDSKSIKTDKILIRVLFSTYKTLFDSIGIVCNYARVQVVAYKSKDPHTQWYLVLGNWFEQNVVLIMENFPIWVLLPDGNKQLTNASFFIGSHGLRRKSI
jgi:hypothetical protein